MRLKNNFIAILILFIFSSLLIFYKFTQIPKYLAFDEVEFTKLALSLDGKPFTPYSPLATGHSTLYFYILLLSLKIFGINVFALRLPAAIFGMLSVIMFYLVIRLSFRALARNLDDEVVVKKGHASLDSSPSGTSNVPSTQNDSWLAFLLTLIFLTSRWFLNFSRFAFEPTFLLFLELTSIYFLLRYTVIPNEDEVRVEKSQKKISPLVRRNVGLGRNDKLFLILSSLFTGLAFNSYTPGRFFFLLPLGFVILNGFDKLTAGSVKDLVPPKAGRNTSLDSSPSAQNDKIKNILSFLIPFLIVISPLIISLSTTKDTRINQLFFWRNHEMTINQKVQGTLQNVSSLTLMFFTKGDMNGRHNYPGKPALNPILGTLFVIGFIYSLKNYKKHYSLLFIIYYLLSLIPSLAIYPWENPSMLRTFTVIPSVVYFIGIAIYNSCAAVTKLYTLKKFLVSCFLFLVILFSSFYELRTYFKYQAKVFESSFEVKYSLDKAIKMKNPKLFYEKNK